ncbi:MAG: imidazole glycerol phosphate synthase subunit HisH [Candidatus Omnitrophica bacterium]|nr:imidazole glycerol phosphate synthase subunit HisH [Candidatus Omnitrophota bacterium]MDD5775114.1 imidazole glycerol phosphate synthase subunit HisH [Candidatus Omnitrophota bacterium]
MDVIGVIQYDMGNIRSVVNALEYLSVPVKIISRPQDVSAVGKIILPGVGAFGEAMAKLREKNMIEALDLEVRKKGKFFLGICLGMQLICRNSCEFGDFSGLGWLDAGVRRLPDAPGISVPHVGWNNLIIRKSGRLIRTPENRDGPEAYFVHSYYVDASGADFVAATCEHGVEFAAMIEQDNIFATQFHPEKSQSTGLEILENFAQLR